MDDMVVIADHSKCLFSRHGGIVRVAANSLRSFRANCYQVSPITISPNSSPSAFSNRLVHPCITYALRPTCYIYRYIFNSGFHGNRLRQIYPEPFDCNNSYGHSV